MNKDPNTLISYNIVYFLSRKFNFKTYLYSKNQLGKTGKKKYIINIIKMN